MNAAVIHPASNCTKRPLPSHNSADTFRLSRRLFAVDGTFLKAQFVLTLLVAVGIDANGEIVLLAWAVVESENGPAWEWFLQHLRWSIPSLAGEPATVISDRDKRLAEAQRVLRPLVVAAHCCYHLKGNFTNRFRRALSPDF
ncbi:uncharacterized protein BP5553_00894 [Venustampulla echinocandica]|uniref:MULE transposase domain-containing protein n=1 Tax=Venustampulla echinocandica TaxID=2656787 RepID=A0A370TZG8_9HELO|nr:uncharacterized protein BP5553_00894 [Venustampulla echinocandica]RDL40915.1 hypothetical protein BP5553_00894 [Venustampulla echinocandica]